MSWQRGLRWLLILLGISLGWRTAVRPTTAAPLLQIPTNDDFANAISVTAGPYTDTQATAAATTQVNDPDYPCLGNFATTNFQQGWHSVWYAVTPPASGTMAINTNASDYDTVLAVWTGTFGSLTNVGCNDDGGTGLRSALNVAVNAGTTYYVEVVGYSNASFGTMGISINLPAPWNDEFDYAIVMGSMPYSFTQSTVAATTAADDPLLSCGWAGPDDHSRSVWYTYTPPSDGILHVDTFGSNFDTVLAAWSGVRGALVEEACNDDADLGGGVLQSSVDFPVTSGVTYYIESASFGNGAGGTLDIFADFTPFPPFTNCTDYVTNGSFESGFTAWTTAGSPAIVTSPVFSGTNSARLGNRNNANDAFFQSITLPANADVAVFRFQWYLTSSDSRTQKRDFLYAQIRDSGGVPITQIFPIDNTYGLNDWEQATLSWTGASLYAGQTIDLYFQGTTNNNNPSAFYIDEVTFAMCPNLQPNLNITKTDAPDPVVPGQTITYTLDYSNTGLGSALNTGITDTLPADVTFGGVVRMPVTATLVSSAPPVWSLGTLAPGASDTIVFTGTVSSTASGSLNNSVIISDGSVSDTDTAATAVLSPAALSATLTAAPTSVPVGAAITITMQVDNTGGITATNVVPSALTMAGTGTAVLTSGPVPAAANIPPGGSQTYQWVVTAFAPGTVNWTGGASGTDAVLGTAVSAPAVTSNNVTISPPIKMETGTAAVDHNWQTITLTNTYTNMVVVASVNYNNNTIPIVARVRNASGGSFDIRLQNPSDTTPLSLETIHYIVMEAGAYVLPDGRAIEAQSYLSTVTDDSGNWNGEAQSYLQTYTNPVVLGQVMTANDPDWSTFWTRGPSRGDPPDAGTLVTGKQVAGDTDTTRANETVGFIVVEQGNGSFDGIAYESALGSNSVRSVTNAPPYVYTFNVLFASQPQVGIISQAGMNGNDGSWPYFFGPAPFAAAQMDLALDEDQIGDPERNHANEQVGYLVFARPFALTPYDLVIAKSDVPDPVIAGQPITYTLTVTNSGYAPAVNGRLTDTLPADVTFGGVVSAPVTATLVSSAPPNWSLGAMASGDTATIVFTGTVSSSASGIITNTAVIGQSQSDDRPVNNTAVVTTTVLQPAAVQFITTTYSVDENAGTAVITVTLDAPFSQTVTVAYASSDGTAMAGSDYLTSTGTLTFTPGVITQTFIVTIQDDFINETNETITLTLTNPSVNAILGTNNPATLVIIDDDGTPPALQFSAPAFSVGESDGTAVITVTLTPAFGLPVTVDYASSDGTAAAGSDYTAVSGTLTFTVGSIIQTFSLPITGDLLDENDETVQLTLSSPVNGVITATNPVTLTILDDDSPPTVQFSSLTYSVNENGGTAVLPVNLSAASGLTVTVNFATSDGTAVSGSDYTGASGTLTFAPGVTSQNINITLLNDGAPEADETFNVTLSAPANASLGAANPAIVTITDDDAAAGQVTIDKGVTPAVVNTPGQLITYTYTITISNAGPSKVKVEQITDTLPIGFSYVPGTTIVNGLPAPDSITVAGQTVTWGYGAPRPSINAGQSATLTFTAVASVSGGIYCNSAGVTIQGSIGVVSANGLACVTVNWPEYIIITQAGPLTIRVRVRLVLGNPVILSWDISP